MGERRIKQTKRVRFLAENPLCCFCGGSIEATTVDHVPNRAFFVDRDWPEGYEFPSCASCQDASRGAELACTAVLRSAPATKQIDYKEIAKHLKGLATNDLEAFREFIGPERSSGLTLPAAVRARLHRPDGVLFNLGPKIHAYIDEYVIKLTKALYYKHCGRAVPAEAVIEFAIASNAEIGQQRERQINAMRFPGTPMLVRCSNARTKGPVSEQFAYSFLGSEPPGDAVFKIRLHQALIVASTVMLNPVDSDPNGAPPGVHPDDLVPA
jgi:hypothetical protein